MTADTNLNVESFSAAQKDCQLVGDGLRKLHTHIYLYLLLRLELAPVKPKSYPLNPKWLQLSKFSFPVWYTRLQGSIFAGCFAQEASLVFMSLGAKKLRFRVTVSISHNV